MNHRILILNFTVPKQISTKLRVEKLDVTVSKHKPANSMITSQQSKSHAECSGNPYIGIFLFASLTRVIIYSPPQDNQYKCKGLVISQSEISQRTTTAYDFFNLKIIFISSLKIAFN